MIWRNAFCRKIVPFCQWIIMLISIVSACSVHSNMTVYAEDIVSPNRIVVFPIWAEEILLELVDIDRLVWVGHPYLEEAEMYWPTMKETKNICGTIWQECDDAEILSLSPDLIVWPYELANDYSAILPNLYEAQIPVAFLKKPDSASEIANTIITLGNITGERQKAAALYNRFQSEVEELAALRSMIPENKRLAAILDDEWQEDFQLVADITGIVNLLQGCENYFEMSDDRIAELNPDIVVKLNVYLDSNGLYLPVQTTEENHYPVAAINLHPSQYIIQDCYTIMQKAYPFLFAQQE